MNIKLLPLVDLDVYDLRIDRGHDRPKLMIIIVSKILDKFIILSPEFLFLIKI